MAGFDPTHAVRFDLPRGSVVAGGDERHVLLPCAALDDLVLTAGTEAATSVGRALGTSIGEQVAARFGGTAALRATPIEEVVRELAGELATRGLGVASVERWGRALVVAIDRPAVADLTFLASIVEGMLEGASDTPARCTSLGRDGGVDARPRGQRGGDDPRARHAGYGSRVGRRAGAPAAEGRGRAVSDDLRIAKLEALLARIRSRSAPRAPPRRLPPRDAGLANRPRRTRSLEPATPLAAFRAEPRPAPPPALATVADARSAAVPAARAHEAHVAPRGARRALRDALPRASRPSPSAAPSPRATGRGPRTSRRRWRSSSSTSIPTRRCPPRRSPSPRSKRRTRPAHPALTSPRRDPSSES